MKIEQIAAQLYTLRTELKTTEQVPETLHRVAEIGYRAVQISGIGADVPEQWVTDAARDHGLTICARHDPAKIILDDTESVIERVQAMGCLHTCYPFPGGIDFGSEASVSTLIQKLNRAGKLFANAGLVLSYHNHHHEFRKLNGQIILERIYAETDPAWIKAELDTYWIQYGGGDPVAWCEKMAGRMPLIHLKDFMINDKSEIVYAEIGNGNLDFSRIISAAEKSGCEWFIIEQDQCPGDPFDSLRQSFEYLKKHFVE